MTSWLTVIVWISFGLHICKFTSNMSLLVIDGPVLIDCGCVITDLGMLFGDLCLEMDLALQLRSPTTAIKISFLPNDFNPCLTVEKDFGHLPKEVEVRGDSHFCSRFAHLIDSLLLTIDQAGAAVALPVGANMIKEFCNKEGAFSDLADFEIDCTAVTGTGKMLTGSTGSYTVNAGTPLTLEVFKTTKEDIIVEDPGINEQMWGGVGVGLVPTTCKGDAQVRTS